MLKKTQAIELKRFTESNRNFLNDSVVNIETISAAVIDSFVYYDNSEQIIHTKLFLLSRLLELS